MPQTALSDHEASPRPTVAKPRNMAPKEHGAWGQLGYPLVVALGLGKPGLVALGLSAAAVALFMAHEPLVVLLGQRGTRAAREAATPAKWRLWGLVAFAVIIGAAATLAGDWNVRAAILACLGAVLVAVFAFLLRGQERSTFGEIWIAWTLPSAVLPVALASGASVKLALVAWISLALAHCAGVYGVRGIIRNYREKSADSGWFGLGTVLLGIALLAVWSVAASLAALLFWAVVAACLSNRPTPKALKQIGWLLVATSAVQATGLVVGLRWLA